jgi:tetratricopeptide (TPR) repeat protein
MPLGGTVGGALDLQAVIRYAREGRLVVLAGAGVSMEPPSSLPSWLTLNRMILEALYRRVGAYLGPFGTDLDAPFAQVLERRDIEQVFAPDYQAQIMEEQVGTTYFRVLQSLDLTQRNWTHEAIAALAARGQLRAVATTNFDRLIETALAAHGIRFRTAIDAEGYRRLGRRLAQTSAATLPVVKVHGSVEDVASLVDTLRQRLQGRGQALRSVLDRLLRDNYWVYCGFSGADLDFDPDYLGLAAAASDSPGFTWVHLPGTTPRPSAQALAERYGNKAAFVAATLPDFFGALLSSLEIPSPPTPPVQVEDPGGDVELRIQQWAEGLHATDAISVLSALLEGAGQERAALWLLHWTWVTARLPEDTSGPAYSRYLFNYGRLALLEGETKYIETPQNFFRSREDILEANLGAGVFFAYTGQRNDALGFFTDAIKGVNQEHPPPSLAGDLVLAFVEYALIYYGEVKRALGFISWALDYVTKDGDLPRRGRLLAARAYILALSGAGAKDAALEACPEVESIARRLGFDVLLGQVFLARATALSNLPETRGEAVGLFREAAEMFSRYRRLPLLLPTYLYWMEAAWMEGETEMAQTAYEQASALLKYIPAFGAKLHFVVGRLYKSQGDQDEATQQFSLAREIAVEIDDQPMTQLIDRTMEKQG